MAKRSQGAQAIDLNYGKAFIIVVAMRVNNKVLAKKGKMLAIVNDLKERMRELDKMKKDIEFKKVSLNSSPAKSKALLEEIKVPPLAMLKESSK
jgi:hypothetical protein